MKRMVASGDWNALARFARHLKDKTTKSEMQEKEKFYAPPSRLNGKGERTILITGAAGFIGSLLAERLLREGHRVIGLDVISLSKDLNLKPCSRELIEKYICDQDIKRQNVERCLGHPRYKFYENVDIRDEESLDRVFEENRIDQVVHMAALAGVRDSFKAPQMYMEIDEKGTERVLSRAVKYRIRYFLLASSSSVYGEAKDGRPSREEDPLDPRAPYPAAKAGAELWAHTYHNMVEELIHSGKREKDKPLWICIIRFFTVYGRRGRREMALRKFIELITKGKPIPIYGDGSQSRNFTHADDIVEGTVRALEHPYPCEVFNLGGAETTVLNDAIKMLEDNLGKRAIRDYQPIQPGDIHNSRADISKAQRMLDYLPSVSIEEGIRDLCRWYKMWLPFKEAYDRYERLHDKSRTEGRQYTRLDLDEALSIHEELERLIRACQDDSEYLVAYCYLSRIYNLIADISDSLLL